MQDASNDAIINLPQQQQDCHEQHKQRKNKRPLLSDDEAASATCVPPVATMTRLTTGTLVRTLPPYLYTFTSFAKGRWVGRTVLDVYSDEFGAYPASYYRTAIAQGRLTVNGARVTADHIIAGRDELRHCVHRHEPAVAVGLDAPPYFRIVAETDEIVAIDKPASIPIHACGAYHRNSLMAILGYETRLGKLYTIHRLDRLTSGLVVLAKNSHVAQLWGRSMTDRMCEKIYLARVKGRFGTNFVGNSGSSSVVPSLPGPTFPVLGEWTTESSSKEKDAASLRKRHAHGYWTTNGNGEACNDDAPQQPWAIEHSLDELLRSLDNDGVVRPDDDKEDDDNGQDDHRSSPPIRWLTLACPVRLKRPKDGVCACGSFADLDDVSYVKTVKSAQTAIAVVRYNQDDDTTLIVAKPATGRTHQIRLHLHHLHHPIANDPNYNDDDSDDDGEDSMWFGNPEGRAAAATAQRVLLKGGSSTGSTTMSCTTPATEAEIGMAVSSSSTTTPFVLPDDSDESSSLEELVQRTCVWCSRLRGASSMSAQEQALHEFQVRSPGLWLHALRYRINKESTVVFQTDILPKWAAAVVEESSAASSST